MGFTTAKHCVLQQYTVFTGTFIAALDINFSHMF